MKILFALCLSLFLGGCVSPILTMNEKNQNHLVFEEMRQELSDVKHSLQSTQLSLQILEEKLQSQDHSLTSLKQQELSKHPKSEQLNFQIITVEKKIALLEEFQEKCSSDFKHLQNQTHQMLQKIREFEKEIALQKLHQEDIAQLKTTLTSISQVMHQKPSSLLKIHRVKAGETLEKIARTYHTTVNALKKQNQMKDDRILVGDEIEIPNE